MEISRKDGIGEKPGFWVMLIGNLCVLLWFTGDIQWEK